MIISKIQLTNFRQYKNEKISFATDKDRNVTVIIGNNAYGKTALVCSFIWCLYREFLLEGPILNADVAKGLPLNSEAVVEVRMDLSHNNSEYRITTKQIFKNQNNRINSISQATTTIVKDGKAISDPFAVETEIDTILKKDVYKYFFYDGEKNRIEAVSKKGSLKKAIYQMMGIDKILTLAEYYKPGSTTGVQNKLNSKLVADNTPELEMWKKTKDSHIQDLDKKNKEIEENKVEIDKLKELYYEKEKILSANKEIENDQRRKLNLNLDIKEQQQKVDTYFENLILNANGRVYSNTLQILYAECYKKFNLAKLKDESSFTSENSLSHINEQVLDQLIQRGRCLCGAIITDSNDARKHLEEAREHMEPNDYGRYLTDFCNRMESFCDNEDSTYESIIEKAKDLLSLIEKIEKEKEELRDIEERIKGKPDVGEIQKEAIELKAEITLLEKQNDKYERIDIPELEKKIEEVNKEISRLAGNKGNNTLIRKCLAYANTIYNTAENIFNKKQEEVRTELEKQVNEIFNFVYHGDRTIKIDDDFNIRTPLKDDGRMFSESAGTESVKNYSFVTGLICLIKRHLLKDDTGLFDFIEDDNFPIVLDAPFSGVDEIHTQKVCEILPKYCDQVIIMLLPNAFEDAESTLNNKIGKKYIINRISETCGETKEVE